MTVSQVLVIGYCHSADEAEQFLNAVQVQMRPSWSPVILVPSAVNTSNFPPSANLRTLDENETWLDAVAHVGGSAHWIWLFQPHSRPASGSASAIAHWLSKYPSTTAIYGDSLIVRDARIITRPRSSFLRNLSVGAIGECLFFDATVLDVLGDTEQPLSFDAQWYSLIVATFQHSVAHVPVVLSEIDKSEKLATDFVGRSTVLQTLFGKTIVAKRSTQEGNLLLSGDLTDQTVSIIIPSIGSKAEFPDGTEVALIRCLSSLSPVDFDRIAEIIVVAGPSMPDSVVDTVRKMIGDKLGVIRVPDPFNFSVSCNQGAVSAHGSHLLFLNDDIEATKSGWLIDMLGLSILPNVGAVGARLVFPSGKIQHIGVIGNGRTLEPNHLYLNLHPEDVDDPLISACSEFTAVTGAALLVAKQDFLEVGGFCDELPLNYNDVDFCLKLAAKGKTSVSCNAIEMIHRESTSRTPHVTKFERDWLLQWQAAFKRDPYLNIWG